MLLLMWGQAVDRHPEGECKRAGAKTGIVLSVYTRIIVLSKLKA